MDFIQQLFEKLTHLKKKRNTGRFIAMSFIVIILIGAVLLMLPISTKDRLGAEPLTALFTATSATCVTGLVLYDTGAYYSVFGQIVILLMIQIGGLGFMSMLSMLFIATHKNIGIRNRMLIAQSLGLSDMGGGVRIMLHLVTFTLKVETIGAILLALRFVPQFHLKGIWYSIFHSISAFCNAGFDIMGTGIGMESYISDPYVLTVLATLIICGGLGFIVWDDIRVKSVFLRISKTNGSGRKSYFKSLSMYSKLVIIITVILLVGGTLAFLITEWRNPYFAPGNGFGQKLLSSFFQSATTRTAGFASVPQDRLTNSGKFVSIMLMMIGGASGSTAGGIKVATVGIVVIAAFRMIRGRRSLVIFHRQIETRTILCAMSLVVLWMMLVFFGSVFLSTYNNLPILDSMYELTSAYGTVGLSVGVTAHLTTLTKLMFIVYMFFGRVGIMTICMMFMTRSRPSENISYPTGNVIIG